MRITALLCWWNEDPAKLERCVRSLVGVANRLVAVDGAWELMPNGTLRSHPEQTKAITLTAAECGIVTTLCWSSFSLWHSQENKRGFALHMALARDADWIFVIDADEYVASVDATALRLALSDTALDVAQPLVLDGARGRPLPHRRFYRAVPGLHYEGSHQGIRTGDGKWLHGDTTLDGVKLEPALGLTGLIEIGHDYRDRGEERNADDRQYRRARTAAGLR